MIGFILLPLVFILYYAITAADGSFTFSNIAAITDPVHVKSILLSLKLGFLCTLVCLVLSYPLCMILSTFRFRHQSFVVFLFILPMWMNFMLRILAWRLLLSNNGIVNAILKAVGTGHVKMLNTPTAVVFGMVYDFLPFMILPIYNSTVRINKDVIEAARDLGANNLTVLVKIIFPLTLSGVLSGIVMVFVPALTSFVISDLLGVGKVLLIGNVIEQEFMQGTNWHLGSGLSVVLMLLSLQVWHLYRNACRDRHQCHEKKEPHHHARCHQYSAVKRGYRDRYFHDAAVRKIYEPQFRHRFNCTYYV